MKHYVGQLSPNKFNCQSSILQVFKIYQPCYVGLNELVIGEGFLWVGAATLMKDGGIVRCGNHCAGRGDASDRQKWTNLTSMHPLLTAEW